MESIEELRELLTLDDITFTAVLDKNPEKVNLVVSGRSENTLLTFAICVADIPKINILLDKGADLARQPTNVLQLTLGDRYSIHPNPELFELLIAQGAKFPENAEGCDSFISVGLTSLFRRNHSMLGALLENGFDPVACERLAQRSIICNAIYESKDKTSVKWLKRLVDVGCSLTTLEKDYPQNSRVLPS